MATAHYNTAYNSSAERGYQTSFEGASTNTRIRHYIGGYVKAYAHLTTVAYTGVYAKNYSHNWATTYAGYYTKTYVGQYTKTYEGQWTGTYANQYAKQYAKLWSHMWVAAYHKTYTGQYTGAYAGIYTGVYTGVYTNANAYNIQYEGGYEGYFARDGVGNYTKQWEGVYAGSRTYSGQYSGQFTAWYIGYYAAQYERQWSGDYAAQWEKAYHKIWTKSYVGYSESFSTRYEQYAGSRAYSAQYAGFRNNTYGGSRSFQITATATYAATSYTGNYTGAYTGGAQSFFGPRVFFRPYYPYTFYDYEPRAWVGNPVTQYKTYSGTYNLNWVGTASPTSVGSYANPGGGSNYDGVYTGAVAPNKQAYAGYEVWYEDFGVIYWPTNYLGAGPGQWTGTYQGQANYLKQWTTATVYAGQYSGDYGAQYAGSRTYSGQYANSFAVHSFYVSDGSTVNWNAYYTSRFEGTTYVGLYSKLYHGTRPNAFTKQYTKLFAGDRTYAGQYTGQYDHIYEQFWSGIYTGLYEGPQTYGGKATDANFEGAYEGSYTGYYDRQYEGIFDAYYERGYEKQYANQYEKLYAGSREHLFVGYYDAQYTGYFDQTYVGNYGNVYVGYYEGQYTGYYSKNYIGYYSTGYTGTYAGPSGPTYTGTTNYTKTYLGTVPYNQVWVGTSADNLKSGQLATQGVAKIKDGGAWKQAKEIFVKHDNSWAETKAIYTKKNGAWEIVHIGWERTDINISSNKLNFHLYNELIALSKSPGTRPQLINIYVNSGADVYSTSSLPAMDLTASMGTINIGGTSIKHLVRVFVHPDANIIGKSGAGGTTTTSARVGHNGAQGYDAIKTNAAIDLYIENYGVIAGGGGGGGAGGYPVEGSGLNVAGGVGGHGAGYRSDGVYITEGSANVNGQNSSVNLGIHGGNGGLLGQQGTGAGGYNHPAGNIANPGTLDSQYDQSGNGGLPGAAITGYDALRVTFINTGKVWGDSKYKFIT
ncbi:hypothetical protein N9J19_00355 [bacterium]|nr:hypothetical protein [bacterium]